MTKKCECLEKALGCAEALGASVDQVAVRRAFEARELIIPEGLGNTAFVYWMQLHCIRGE